MADKLSSLMESAVVGLQARDDLAEQVVTGALHRRRVRRRVTAATAAAALAGAAAAILVTTGASGGDNVQRLVPVAPRPTIFLDGHPATVSRATTELQYTSQFYLEPPGAGVQPHTSAQEVIDRLHAGRSGIPMGLASATSVEVIFGVFKNPSLQSEGPVPESDKALMDQPVWVVHVTSPLPSPGPGDAPLVEQYSIVRDADNVQVVTMGVGGKPTFEINWDHPYADGVTVQDVAEAKRVGRLPFVPVLPPFDVAPSLIQVTQPHRGPSVAFVFHFPTGPGTGFPTDGRVEVDQTPGSADDEQSYAGVANQPPSMVSKQELVDVGGGKVALLVQAHGIGRVTFTKDAVRYDLTGPAVSPAKAVELARLLYAAS